MNVLRRLARKRIVVFGFMLVMIGGAPAAASSANISHSYNSQGAIPNGSLVSLDTDRSDFVKLANVQNGQQLLGVAVDSDDSLIAVDSAEGKVQVAESGTVSALVSTLNGDIKVGDKISVSPFNGVGARAGADAVVIGLAQTPFNSRSEASSSRTIRDEAGKATRIYFGYVRLNIGITGATGEDGKSVNTLQRWLKNLTGRTIPTAKAIIGLIVILVAVIAIITLTYGSIYSGIISIGRNPLAKFTILGNLGMVFAMTMAIAGIASFTLYLLWR
jgi:hypothetical protein